MNKHIVNLLLVGAVVFVLAGCSKTPGDVFISDQTKSAKAGNHWAEYKLWEAYHNGTQGVDKNTAKADQWLGKFIRGVYVVRFEPANGFKPQNAGDYLKAFTQRQVSLNSDRDRIGIAGFLRTKKDGDRLVASFLTNEPDKLQAYIENNPSLHFVSVEAVTPQMFIEHERSIQESL